MSKPAEAMQPGAVRLDPRILRGLRRLDAAIRGRMAVCGLLKALLALAAAAAASLVADYGIYLTTHQHMTLPQRALVNAFCLAGVLLAVRRHLVRALVGRFTPEDVALVIEKANPALEERLISALHFTRPGAQAALRGASAELVRKVVEQANGIGRSIRFRAVLQSRPVRTALAWAVAGAAAAAAFVAWRPDLAAPWFRRNVLFQEARYPQRTNLRVEGGNPLRLVRGGALDVRVTADPARVVPKEVMFHMRFPSLGDLAESVESGGRGTNVYVKRFPVVSEPFTFYVTGNDDRTSTVRVELEDPPALEELRLTVTPPPYTMQPSVEVRRNQGVLDIAEDSVMKISGKATKDLARVELSVDDRPAGACRLQGAGAAGGPGRRRFEGELTVAAPKPFRPRLSLRIALTDADGFANPKAASYGINLLQDQPPAIQLEVVAMGAQISGKAAVPLLATMKDDYGVAEVALEWSVQSAPQNTVRLPVKDFMPPAPEPAPVRFVFDLQHMTAMARTNAAPLQVGETLRLQACAADSLPVPAGPHKIASNLITLRIATDDEVLDAIVESQRAMREQLTQIKDSQIEVRDRCNTAIEQAGKETTLALAFSTVAGAADSEQQIRDLLGNLVSRLDVLLQRIQGNRVGAKSDETRLRENIIGPLNAAGKDVVLPLIDALAAAKALRDGRALAAALGRLTPMQDDFIRQLEVILAEMIKVENAQQVERNLRQIITLGDKVRDVLKAGARNGGKSAEGEPPAKDAEPPGGGEGGGATESRTTP